MIVFAYCIGIFLFYIFVGTVLAIVLGALEQISPDPSDTLVVIFMWLPIVVAMLILIPIYWMKRK